MSLGSPQPRRELRPPNLSWGGGGVKGGRSVGLTILPPLCVDCLEIWEPQPPGTLRARTGIALALRCLWLQPTVRREQHVHVAKYCVHQIHFRYCRMPSIESEYWISVWQKPKSNHCHFISLHAILHGIYISFLLTFWGPRNVLCNVYCGRNFGDNSARSWSWTITSFCTEVKNAWPYPIRLHIVRRKTSLLHNTSQTRYD
jgi:hypothetical protein